MNYLFLIVALVCALAGEAVAQTWLKKGTVAEWLFATLIFLIFAWLVPWVEARRAT